MKAFILIIAILTLNSFADQPQVKIFVDIVGDLFHAGHINFLKQAKAMGTSLTVGINSDKLAQSYKRKPILTDKERYDVISSCKYVDEIIFLEAPITSELIEKYQFDLVIHGDDFTDAQAEFWYKSAIEKGIYRTIPYTKGISTTNIISRIIQRADEFISSE